MTQTKKALEFGTNEKAPYTAYAMYRAGCYVNDMVRMFPLSSRSVTHREQRSSLSMTLDQPEEGRPQRA